MEHFAGWKFCGVKYTHEIVGAHREALLPERAPGACSRMKTPRVYRPLFRLAAGHKNRFRLMWNARALLRLQTGNSFGLQCYRAETGSVSYVAHDKRVTGC